MSHLTVFRPIYPKPNAHMVEKLRFVPHFEHLRLCWPYGLPASEGMHQFVKEFLPAIRKNNPHVYFALHPSYVPCDVKVIATYEYRRQRQAVLNHKTKYQVLAQVEKYAIGGDFRENNGVRTTIPRGFQLRPEESRGHAVYHVSSKKHGSKYWDDRWYNR